MTDAADVQRAHGDDHEGGEELLSQRAERDELAGIGGEGDRQRGGGPGVDGEEQRPPEEKRWKRPEGLAHVGVRATGIGVRRPELGERQRAEQRADSTDKPNEERDTRIACAVMQHGAGNEPDTGSDDGTDDDEDEVALSERASQSVAQCPAAMPSLRGSEPPA